MHPTPRFHSLVVLLTVLLLTLASLPAAAGAPVRAAELRAAVTGAPAALQVEATSDYTCILKGDGRVICFGADLGLTKRLQTPAGEAFTQFDIGEQHGCGVRPNGTLLCWGGNFHMEGSGVSGAFSQVAAESVETCALDTGGLIHCWGFSYGGTFTGDGFTPLTGQFRFVGMRFGQGCAIRANAQLACWNVSGSPPSAPPPGEFKDLSLGGNHACGVRASGALACWGLPPQNPAPPGSVPTGVIFASVSAGHDATCAITDGGQLRCWGAPGSIVATATLPTGRFSRVSVGQTHACAIRVEGGAVCWGSNGDGQAPPAPSPSAGGPYNVAEGSAITLAGSAAPVGRPLSYAWDLDGDGGFETAGQTPAYTGRDGPSSPAAPLRVCTDQAICGVATASVGVANVAPTAAFPPPAEVAIGRPIPLALTGAADPAPADAAAGFTYAFDCGDGSGYRPEGPASVLNCPAPPGAGQRTVRGRIRDKDGGAREYTAAVTIGPWRTLLWEDFEGNFPAGNGWQFFGEGPNWSAVTCAPYAGARSGWPAGTARPCTGDYATNQDVYLFWGPADLRAARGARLSFHLRRALGSGDEVWALVSYDGVNFPGGWRWDGASNGAWESVTLDLSAIPSGGSALGADAVYVAFFFRSDNITTAAGPYIDDIAFDVCEAAACGGPGPNPPGATTWYFAEGYTGGDFSEFLTIQNPTSAEAQLEVTYFRNRKPPVVKRLTAPANSRRTVAVHNPAEGVGRGEEVAARVVSSNGVPVVVERPMYFTYNGAITGGHNVMGVQAPRRSWLFAEGYTGDGFDEYLTLLNPNPEPAQVTITYFLAAGEPVVKHLTVPGSQRYTVVVHDAREGVGRGQAVSARVETSHAGGIVAERPMYFRYAGDMGAVTGGHNVMGAAGPRRAWHFPDGDTRDGHDTYLTLMNPSGGAAQVRLTYYVVGEGAPRATEITVAKNSRKTVAVHDDAEGVGRGQALSVSVEVLNGVDLVVERPMYFRYSDRVDGGHAALGASAPRRTWLFAEGYTGDGFDEYLVIFNPNATAAAVTVTYYLGGKPPVTKQLTVAAEGRSAVAVHEAALGVGRGEAVSAKVETTHGGGVVAERPVYFVFDGRLDGGHTALGYAP